jgi:hypothetical protein
MSPAVSPTLLDANGFLRPGLSLTQLISESVLPPTATVKLEVYDVGDKAGLCCGASRCCAVQPRMGDKSLSGWRSLAIVRRAVCRIRSTAGWRQNNSV